MGAPPIHRDAPEEMTTPAQRLQRIAVAFQENLERIREKALGPAGELQAVAAESVQGTGAPKKHIVAAACACCADTLSRLYGPVAWRSGVGTKVKDIVSAIENDVFQIQDTMWPSIREFLFDFSVSNYPLTQLIGKSQVAWPVGKLFRMYLVAESELNGASPSDRRYLVTRDLVKLCLLPSDIKMLIYAGYEHHDPKQLAMLGAIQKTISRCSERWAAENWLFVGLVGRWPAFQACNFHVINPATETLDMLEL